MFRIRHTLPGTFSINLEKGCITLQRGQSFDIEKDGGCSRKWLNSDPVLRQHINNGILVVVFDSAKQVEKAPIHNAVKTNASKKKINKKKPAKPIIVDFGKGEDIDIKEYTEEKTKEVDTDNTSIEYSEGTKLENPVFESKLEEKVFPNFDSMTKAELVAFAEFKNIKINKQSRKAKVLETIKEYWENLGED